MAAHYSESYFATAATIIPVLLLALTLQGDFLARLVGRALRSLATSLLSVDPHHRVRQTARQWGHTTWFILCCLGFIGVLGLGVAGEFVAVVDLGRQGAASGEAAFVLESTITLLIATAAAVLLRTWDDPRTKEARKELRRIASEEFGHLRSASRKDSTDETQSAFSSPKHEPPPESN